MPRPFPLLLTAWLAAVLPSPGAPLRIACIGDSITEGAGLNNPALESYPVRLQRLLGTNDFTVRNFGVSGRTLLKKGDFPYWNETAYRQSRDWNPNVVIIQLGTNDSKPQNWRHSTSFVADYEDLIASYTNLASQPRILLCTPCPVYRTGAFEIRPGIVATNLAPLVRELGARLGWPVVELHERLAGHPEWFPDTVHPNTRGMAVMAAVMAEALAPVPSPEPPPAMLGLTRVGTRVRLHWSSELATHVVLSATGPGPTSVWTVVDPVPYRDGNDLRLTNTVTGSTRFFRLWRP